MLKIPGPSYCGCVYPPEEAGWAGLVSRQSGEAVLAIGDGVTVCADTGTWDTAHCAMFSVRTGDGIIVHVLCFLFSPAPGPVRTLQWPSWPILMQNPRHSRDNCQALGTTLTRKKFLQHPSFAFEQCH